MKNRDRELFSYILYGSSVVGERGQVVIPKKARTALGIKPGNSVLFIGSRIGPGLMIIRSDVLNQFLSRIVRKLEKLTKGRK
jgi:AbrB family looped-hinge helix DNA binding protein